MYIANVFPPQWIVCLLSLFIAFICKREALHIYLEEFVEEIKEFKWI